MKTYKGGWGEFVGLMIGFGVVICLIVGAWTISSHFEAAAFNEATGKNVSTWNAMWIELRVQESTRD